MRARTAVLEATTTTTEAVEELENQDAILSVADDLRDLAAARLLPGKQQAQALAIATAAAAVQNGVSLRAVKALIDAWGE